MSESVYELVRLSLWGPNLRLGLFQKDCLRVKTSRDQRGFLLNNILCEVQMLQRFT